MRAFVTVVCLLLGACQSSMAPSGGDMARAPADLATAQARDMATPKPVDMAPAVIIRATAMDTWDPPEVTIHVGEKVQWVILAPAHGVFPTGPDMGFVGSPVIQSGTYEFTFMAPGTYNYHCAVHGPVMPGKVTVLP